MQAEIDHFFESVVLLAEDEHEAELLTRLERKITVVNEGGPVWLIIE